MTTFLDGDQLSADDLNNNLPPIGCILPYGGSSAPNAEWLLCQGQAISRTTYSTLFTRFGTTYGAGDGSTTFNIPNMQNHLVIGLGSGEYTPLGDNGDTLVRGGSDAGIMILNFIVKAK